MPYPEQFRAEVAWPEDWPTEDGAGLVGSHGDAEEAHMDEDMTDLLDCLGGSRATRSRSPDL